MSATKVSSTAIPYSITLDRTKGNFLTGSASNKKKLHKKVLKEVYMFLYDIANEMKNVDVVDGQYVIGGENGITIDKIKDLFEKTDPWDAKAFINGEWVSVNPTYEKLFEMFVKDKEIADSENY